MGSPILPRDQNGHAIQVMRLVDGGAHHDLAVTAAASVRSAAFNAATKVITVFATAAIYFRLGDGNVVAAATDHYIPANTLVPIAIKADDQNQTVTNAAYKAVAGNADVHISERE